MASHDVEDLFESLPEQAVPERAARSLPRLRMAERRQVELRAVTLDDLVPDDHRVRLVWRFVEELDLTALHATIKAIEGQPGHPPPDPRILVALWLFATIEGIGSAREVARLCREHIAGQWLCGGVGMNAKTLGDFRIAHRAVLERLLVDSFTALIQAGVASLERVAQDGVGTVEKLGVWSWAGYTGRMFRRLGIRNGVGAALGGEWGGGFVRQCRRAGDRALRGSRRSGEPGSDPRRRQAARGPGPAGGRRCSGPRACGPAAGVPDLRCCMPDQGLPAPPDRHGVRRGHAAAAAI